MVCDILCAYYLVFAKTCGPPADFYHRPLSRPTNLNYENVGLAVTLACRVSSEEVVDSLVALVHSKMQNQD